ncbi:ssDNA endonuclease and repair protein rad10 [Taxawa tesnikishii (nom. ined.)]|nr:ssDNA endonuclease and repair protein rad10 [Dothideales sp. JES 119]
MADNSGCDAANRAATSASSGHRKVQQPKPQALPSRGGPNAILVSPRQKGNPILGCIKIVPWEYSDIPADYVLGQTTCALFLSLKYHRLHPEYIYSRIRALAGKYNLRIVLTMVDIPNHEEPLKELSKTSVINNVTVILCWSAQEAGRYLEQFKSLEHAAPISIKAQQSTTYSDKLVEFITVPRGINKTDAVGLVSNFGSVRTAVNARPEEIALVGGWGEKKVQRWCQTVREPFRIKRTARRAITREDTDTPRTQTRIEDERDAQVAARLGIGAVPVTELGPSRPDTTAGTPDADRRADTRMADTWEPDADDEEAMAALEAPSVANEAPAAPSKKRRPADEDLSESMMAALSKLRKT